MNKQINCETFQKLRQYVRAEGLVMLVPQGQARLKARRKVRRISRFILRMTD
jgi:hypothetical protein